MILVTGASGLIGSFIVKDLHRQGFKVKVLKRQTSNLASFNAIAKDLIYAEGDIMDLASLELAMTDVEYVIHSAGFISFKTQDAKKLFQINVEGTANVVNTALKSSVKKLVHISSIAAIGKKKDATDIVEDEKWDDNNVSNYAKSKYLGELEVWRGSSEGLNVGILNPSIVLGPGDWNFGSTEMFKYVWDKKPFVTKGNVNFVDVRDVANAAIILLKSEISNERFILNSGTTSFHDLFTKIACFFKKTAPWITVPKGLVFSLIFLEKVRSTIMFSNPIINNDFASGAFNKSIYNNKKAKEILNLSFKELDETVKWVCVELAKKYNLEINN